MKQTSMVLAMVSFLLLPVAVEAGDWRWKRVDRADGIIRLTSSPHADGMAEGVDQGTSRDMGNTFHVEFAWWGFDDWHQYQIEAAFYWAKDRGGWEWVRSTGFFDEFGALDSSWIETGASDGPVIDSAIGEITTYAFDIDSDAFGEDIRQCIGFNHGWDHRNLGGWQHYPKILAFYACGNGGRMVSEETLLTILSGLSIGGEFEALVEDD